MIHTITSEEMQQLQKMPCSGQEAKEGLNRIYEEVMASIEKGNLFYICTNSPATINGVDPKYKHHILISEEVINEAKEAQ